MRPDEDLQNRETNMNLKHLLQRRAALALGAA
jgi:hypothetical protein